MPKLFFKAVLLREHDRQFGLFVMLLHGLHRLRWLLLPHCPGNALMDLNEGVPVVFVGVVRHARQDGLLNQRLHRLGQNFK